MSHHICTECGGEMFTIVERVVGSYRVKLFQCMGCGAEDKMEEKPIMVAKDKKVNTGIRRMPKFKEEYLYKPRIQDYQQLLRRWKDEWKRRANGNVG